MSKTEQFQTQFQYNLLEQGSVSVQCPSNIALIKYWGKYTPQLPANASLSFTLKNSYTETQINFKQSSHLIVETILGNEKKESFAIKIKEYLLSIKHYLPFVEKYHFQIHTQNSFPHSSGIASSASGFGAIALGLMEMAELFGESFSSEQKYKKASFLARLGSGSACRSLYKGAVVWGKHPQIPNSSDLYGIPFPFEIHPVFFNFNDTILLIHEGTKTVSSTVGHGLMKNHPYAKPRFIHANENLTKITKILQEGNLTEFGKLVEHEALSLHALMLMSDPAFILMKPGTLAVIEKIWEFRTHTHAHLYFTLDAGANLHLLYPENEKTLIFDFIKNTLLKYTENGKLIVDTIDFSSRP